MKEGKDLHLLHLTLNACYLTIMRSSQVEHLQNIYRAPFWSLSRANVRMSFPSSQRLLVFQYMVTSENKKTLGTSHNSQYISGTILNSVTRKCAYVIPIVPASSCFSIWWPQKTRRPWGQATTANWVVAKHWMRMPKNWHDPMCLLRSTCTYYFFYLKKKK